MVGGKDEDDNPSDKCYLLDTKTQTLTQKAELPIALAAHAVCYTETKGELRGAGINCGPTVNRLVFSFGGRHHVNESRSHKYDVDSDRWSAVASMPLESYSFNVLPVTNNLIYAFIR